MSFYFLTSNIWEFHIFANTLYAAAGTPLQYSCLENPWMEEPGRLQSMGLLRVRHDWTTSLTAVWRQPTRLPRPWNSPGKNTGVGCHFLPQSLKVESESEVAQSCLTLSDPMDCSLPGFSAHGIFQARILEWAAISSFKIYTSYSKKEIEEERRKVLHTKFF